MTRLTPVVLEICRTNFRVGPRREAGSGCGKCPIATVCLDNPRGVVNAETHEAWVRRVNAAATERRAP